MSKRRLFLILCASLPAVVVGAIGLLHPHHLDAGSAAVWRTMHIVLIPLFPLIGVAPWLIARRVDRRLGWLAAVGGYGFATFYTALDLIAGVAAGTVQLAGIPEAKGPLYDIARTFGLIGVVSLAFACLVAGVAVVIRRRLSAVPGAALSLAGAILVQPGHIYPGTGTLAMGLLAAGFALLAVEVTRKGGADDGPALSATSSQ